MSTDLVHFFKESDETEKKFFRVMQNQLALLNAQRGLTFGLAYDCFLLGDVLHNLKNAPLTKSVKKEVFREVFNIIFNNLLSAGNPEAYLSTFRQIFGASVVVEFTIVDPGHIEILIETDSLDISDWEADELTGQTYAFFDIVDNDDDEIVFIGIEGFETPREVEIFLFEVTPYGIFTEVTLTIL